MITKLRAKFILILVIFSLVILAATSASADGEISISGPINVRLSFDDILAPATPVKTEPECTGGGLLGAVNCVTKKMEGVSTAIDSSEGSGKTIGVTLNGEIIPQLSNTGNGKYQITLKVNIKPPVFSPSIADIPADILSKTGKDEAKIKLGLAKWSKTVSNTELEKQPLISYSLNEYFSDLVLFKVYAPKNPTVSVSWKSAKCDDLYAQYLETQKEYLEAMAAIPVLEQFDRLTETMDEINFALAGTANGLDDQAGKIGDFLDDSPAEKKIEELKEQTENLSESLTDSLDKIKEGIKSNREKLLAAFPKSSDAAKKVQSGLSKSAKTMKQVSEAVDGINNRLKYMQEMFKAADGNPSDQLQSFQKFYSDITEKLGPLVKTIPVLGVFLDLYGRAISQITDSVKQIETEVKKREQMYKRAGGMFASRPLYMKPGDSRQRLERQRNNLFQKLEGLQNRLLKECPSVKFEDQTFSRYQAIKDARDRAENACKKIKPDQKLQQQLRKEFKDARKAYLWPNWTTIRERYNSKNAFYTRLKTSRDKMRDKKALSKDERGEIANDFKAIYTEMRTIGEYKKSRMDVRLADKTKPFVLGPYEEQIYRQYVEAERLENNKLAAEVRKQRPARERYNKAKAEISKFKQREDTYKTCLKKQIKLLADKNNWSDGDLRLYHPGLFDR